MSALQLAQVDATGRTVTLIVLGLVAVAAALALLTAWYWRITDPRRTAAGSNPPDDPLRRRSPEGPDNGGQKPVASPAPAADPPADQTAVYDRHAIVAHTESADTDRPEPEPPSSADGEPGDDPAPLSSPSPVVETGTPPGTDDDVVIDLRDPAPTAQPTTDDHRGLTFEEWLALAEEDR